MTTINSEQIRLRTPWSSSSIVRRHLTEELGEELESWIRARVQRGYTDDQMRDLLREQAGVTIASKTMSSWRRDLGYRKQKIKRKSLS